MKGRILASRIADRTPAEIRTLIRRHGSVRAAAKALGLPRSTLFDMATRRVTKGLRRHMQVGQ